MFFENNINNNNYNSSHSLYPFTVLGFIFFSHSVISDSCDPMDYSPPGSPVHGISQARILEWVAISFSREPSDPGVEPRSPVSLALQADSIFLYCARIHANFLFSFSEMGP